MSTKSSVLTNTVSSLKSVGVKLFFVLLISLLIGIPISTFLNGMISGLIDDLPASVAFVLNTIVSLAVTSFLIMLAVRLLILNPLYEAVRTMKKVANGDLRTELEIHTKGEFGQLAVAFNRMTDNLRALIEDVRTNSDQVVDTSKQFIDQVQLTTASSKEINTMLREVATGTDKQLSGAEQTAQIMDKMTAGIHRIAESASVVAEMSNKATEEVDSGKTFIIKVREQMDAIDSVTDNVADEIQQLSSHSKEINQIVNVITEIANQTNLLALNVAIEAARAGCSERSSKAAEQSERSASQISELVKRIQTHTQQTVSVMNNGKKEVENGTLVIGDADNHLKKSLPSLKRLPAKSKMSLLPSRKFQRALSKYIHQRLKRHESQENQQNVPCRYL